MKREKGVVTTDERKGSAPGTSLIEVLVAIGLIAGALVSIGSMFALGSRQVKAGRTQSEATALAQDIVETIGKRSFTTLYTSLGASPTDATRTVDSAALGGPLAPWAAAIARRLENGQALATIEALGEGARDFGGASCIKLTVTVSWSEAERPRKVVLATVRF